MFKPLQGLRQTDREHLQEFAFIQRAPSFGHDTFGQVDFDALIGVGNDRVHRGEMPPASTLIAGLLEQFTLAGGKRRFAGVDFASREFDEIALQGITVLALHHQITIIQHWNNHHRTRMPYPLAFGCAAIGQSHGVITHIEKGTPIGLARRHGMLGQIAFLAARQATVTQGLTAAHQRGHDTHAPVHQ